MPPKPTRRGTGSSILNASGSLGVQPPQQQQQYFQQQQQQQFQQYQYPQLQPQQQQQQQYHPMSSRSSPSMPSITRSASPSSSISNFFSRPTKWFSRQGSTSKTSPVEPRPSTSSISSSRRRPTISGPTDPRPIETLPTPTPRKDGKLGGGLANLSDRASRSVLDLSRASVDLNTATEPASGGLGDLRSISRKAWSKSADNLSSAPVPTVPKLAPLNTEVTMEMKIEQYRTGSPATPRSTNKAYPFPSMIPGTPSTPPSNDSLHQLRKTSSHSHAHSASGSASSLPISSGALSPGARLAPPSPKQHGGPPRKRSFDFDRAKTRQHSDSSPNSTNGRSSAFPFFGGPPAPERKGSFPAAATSTSTPTIVEPEAPVREESKRASQIVHRSGFINRLQNFSVSSPQLSSSKNWKPYKLVLKGSKMHFYKPPSDRAALIKELFPSGLVSLTEEDAEEEEGAVGKLNGANKDRDDSSRRKRAFWGRRTHPDLVVKDGRIESGTLEALVHEAVFGTTFSVRSASPGGEENDWRNFASSVLLTIPYLVECEKVEFEFQRCSSYLVSGADESEQEFERERVEWLVSRYLAYHGSPADEDSWNKYCKDTIPSFKPESVSMPTPAMSAPPKISVDSPNMGTFSPRPPHTDNVPVLTSSMHLHTPSSRPDPTSPARSMRSPASRTRVWTALDQEGFTREVFLKLDVDSVARSLLHFHRSCLDVSPKLYADALLSESSDAPPMLYFGTDDSPHWLTRTIIVQILGPGHVSGRWDGVSSSSGSAQAHHRNVTDERGSSSSSSRTHVRSEVISRWARVGELCRHAGDETSWHAIMDALCSKPIARLEKAWKRVESSALSAVRTWVYASPSGERAGVPEPKRTPWCGEGRYRALEILRKIREAKGGEWPVALMADIRSIYAEFQGAAVACAREQHRRDVSEDDDVLRLVQLWREVAKKAPKTLRIDQYMSLSFAAEQKRKGLYAPYYWSRSSAHGIQALVPLIFPEPLPYTSLIDRSNIIRAKKTSFDSAAVFNDAQAARLLELKRTIEPNGVIRANGVVRSGPRGNSFDLGGMILPVFDGELLLTVVPGSDTASRPVSTVENEFGIHPEATPPSRAPSIRVKSAAAGLDRKSSRLRRSSLPTLSQKTPVVETEQNDERPLRALIQAGTLDALVHFLIHGLEGVSVSVADDNGEMALRDKKTKAVKVDRAEFASVWWNVFRSFVSPFVLFQLIRKEYLSASAPSASTNVEEYFKVVHTRLAVIRVLGEWIHAGGGAQDALDDLELQSAIQTFLSQQDHTLVPSDALSEALTQLWKDLESGRSSLLETFHAQTMRPQTRHVPVRGSVSNTGNHNFGVRAPRLEELTPEELVNNLDAMASAAFRNVVQEDLFVTADLLEVQTADRTGWFLPKEPTPSTEEVEIQTMYTYIMETESTSLIGELSGDILYRLLPPGIRSLIRAYNILRKWAICSIVSPQISTKARQARMEMFLKAIEICRIRNADDQTIINDANPAERPGVRSFVEAVLTSAIVSPESRLFTKGWQMVATARGAQVESLMSMLSIRTVHSIESQEKLTVDPAWLIERMLEVISLVDVLDSPMETPLSLINFDKRRQLCNIITNSSSFASRSSRQRREMDRCDFERLNRIEAEYAELQLDFRMLKDDAHREATNFGPTSTPSGKRIARPFLRSIAAQQEKIKRDRYIRERLLKEKRLEQQRLERKEDDLNRLLDTRGSQGTPHKAHRSKRSMSALFNLMRPISTAFSSESTGISLRRSPAELDFVPSNKPAFVLSLVDAHVAAFINNEKSFTFQVDTEDGGHYLFQALNKNDLNLWIKAISTAVQSYAQRRLTYIGDASQLQFTDHMQPRSAAPAQDPGAVFGVDIDTILKREAHGEDVSPDAVPRVLELLLSEIETRGLTEQGIYRVAGATTEVTAMREALNKGQTNIDPMSDIHAVCGVVKYWFRNLPETVIPEKFFDPIIEAARLPDLDERLAKIREVVHFLPRTHYSVLRRFAEHLDKVVDYEEKNHMTPDNLATVICPNLLRAPNNNFGLIMKNMGPIIVLFKALITHVHLIFDESDGEEEEEHAEGESGPLSEDLVPPEVGDDGFLSDPRFTSSPEPEESPVPDIVLHSSQDA